MSDAALQVQIDAANAYEQLFVPALFQEWAPRVVAAAKIQRGHSVLDVACGTGVLAREAAERVGSVGSVAGLDLSPGMLAVAARLAAGVEWHLGSAEALPFADRTFDAVVSQFGLMFFSDRRQALREMLRVLAPGGRLAVAVWDRLETTPAHTAEVELLERLAGQRAGDALRSLTALATGGPPAKRPFALDDRQKLAALFASAGVASVAATTQRGTARFPSIRAMVEADLRGWLPVWGVVLPEGQIQLILTEAERALAPYVPAGEGARFDLSAHIVSGTTT